MDDLVKENVKKIFATLLVEALSSYPVHTRWKGVYAKLYKAKKLGIFDKEILLKQVQEILLVKATHRWTIINDVSAPTEIRKTEN